MNLLKQKQINKNILIIPARGGSKGIKKKNLIPINGKPLLHWTLKEAKKSKLIDRILISTDDTQISKFVKTYDVGVVKRPKSISGDHSSSESAIIHVIKRLKNNFLSDDLIIFLQCTSPLITHEDIDKGITFLKRNNLDSTFACTFFKGFLWKEENKKMIGINHNEKKRLMRQNIQKQFLETGSIYIMKTKIFLREKYRFCGNCRPFFIDKIKNLDIDHNEDIAAAEYFLKYNKKKIIIPFIPKAIIMDFDGVHTNNKFSINKKGVESVTCSRSDGMGIESLKKHSSIKLLILSNEKNIVVSNRAKKLNIECIQSPKKKVTILSNWLKQNKLKFSEVAFIGNDINDLECIEKVGISFCPYDAEIKIKSRVNFILEKIGGDGVIRELSDIILSNINHD